MANEFMADRVTSLKASAIREIFKMVGQSDIISLAGGNPSAEIFPKEILASLAEKILREEGTTALQYGVTEGYAPLRAKVKKDLKDKGILHDTDDALITSGGQQLIDLCAKTLINDGDVVAVEAPSFIGGLNCFRSYNGKLIGIDMEDDGMNLDRLEALAKKEKIKLVYTIPTFQNPTGITMSLEKRKRLLEMASIYDFYILEDNPYGALRFSGADIQTIKSMDDSGRVIYAGSFSKVISPGLRVGFGAARADIFDRMVVCKQVQDVHTPCLNQMLVNKFIEEYDFDAHIKKSIDMYKEKCAKMISCMDEYFPSFCTHTVPEGGIFLWCSLSGDYDTKKIMAECIEKKVAFVPGATAMVDIDKPCNQFRLNYSTPTLSDIEKGIFIISEVLKNVGK
ncbi:MAG: PLP-dependent aminotransferase family protein [Bacillota bacterium]|nr:PLP-dependent aminotransferase family protein [Bacillota bacterium]